MPKRCPDDKVIASVQKARDLIAYGWHDGSVDMAVTCAEDGPYYTAYGALRCQGKSPNEADYWTQAYSWLKLWVKRTCFFDDLTTWNNAPGQTQSGILEGFDGLLAHMKEELSPHVEG